MHSKSIGLYRHIHPDTDRVDLIDDGNGDIGILVWGRTYAGNATRADIAEHIFADWRNDARAPEPKAKPTKD